MNGHGPRDSSNRDGLLVRYSFDGCSGEKCEEEARGEEDDEIGELSTVPNSKLGRKTLNHLPKTNSWFNYTNHGSEMQRRALVNSGRLNMRRKSYQLAAGDEIGQKDWQEESENDPGFFTCEKVKQPETDDTVSWDSESCSSTDLDTYDHLPGINHTRRAKYGNTVMKTSRNTNNIAPLHIQWGSTHPPIPPVHQRYKNISYNRADETATDSGGASKTKTENTYRLEPKHGQTFIWWKVRRPMMSIVDQLLDDFAYNVKAGPAVTKKLSEVIVRMTKKTFDLPRYKFVCNVMLIQLKKQGVMVADRTLWNTTYDNAASYVHKSKHLICVVTLHALYSE